MTQAVQREAYERLPESCDTLRELLTKLQDDIMEEFEIPAEELPAIDCHISSAFMAIRDLVTQKFRDEQMTLIDKIHNIQGESNE